MTTALVLMEVLMFVCKQHLLFLNSLGVCFDVAVDLGIMGKEHITCKMRHHVFEVYCAVHGNT